MDTKARLLWGLRIAPVLLFIDWFGRATIFGQLGIKFVPGGFLANIMGVIFSIPPQYFLLILVALYLAWAFAPDRFPRFTAAIIQVQWQDPPVKPDLVAMIVLCVSNHAAPSAALDYRVEATRVNGTKIKVDVGYYPSFDFVVNNGKDKIHYTDEHFITTRTRFAPIVRGVPVTGVLLCLFREMQDPEQVDMRTIQVLIKDGTGDGKGRAKWWPSKLLTQPEQQAVMRREKIIGLPSIEPVV